MKHLCRSFGIDTYQAVQGSCDFLRWVQIPDLKGKEVRGLVKGKCGMSAKKTNSPFQVTIFKCKPLDIVSIISSS